MTNPSLLRALRYLAGPPISEVDLKTLIDSTSLSVTALRQRPERVSQLVETVRAALDQRRFPWVSGDRPPQPGEREAAILATTALAATQSVGTKRRNEGKTKQEAAVRAALLQSGFTRISLPNGEARTLAEAPKPGEFSNEASLAGRKADLIVGLWDHRLMPIECKVSNSSVNSIKRLNNDAAAKAEGWTDDLGRLQVVPVAVLSGVYSLGSLQRAQNRGLTLYWAHRLSDVTGWIERTRPTP
ncbi:MAG: XamI family restriction endonuclease [Chloroflexia bacterium]|nr:XamI family restriction endonuclease [Chloroflexia bacterium]